jgi:hypothetical protein
MTGLQDSILEADPCREEALAGGEEAPPLSAALLSGGSHIEANPHGTS